MDIPASMTDQQKLKLELLQLAHFNPALLGYYSACQAEFLTAIHKADFGIASDPAFQGMSVTIPFGDYNMPIKELQKRFLYVDDLAEEGLLSLEGKSFLQATCMTALAEWHVKTICRLVEQPTTNRNLPDTLSLYYIIDQMETDRGKEVINKLHGNADNNLRVIRQDIDNAWENYGESVQKDFRNPMQHTRAEYFNPEGSKAFQQLHGNMETSNKYHALTDEIHRIFARISEVCFGESKGRIPTGKDFWNGIWSGSKIVPWSFDLELYPVEVPELSDRQRFGDPARFMKN